MKFKIGQKVYYYQTTGEFTGGIVEGIIIKAIKDLATNKVIYTIKTDDCCWCWSSRKDLTADYLYSSRKAIEKEYKEEIVYNHLHEKLDELQKTLDLVYNELTKDEHKGWEGQTLTIDETTAFNTVYVQANDLKIEGVGSVKEELENLKKEVNKIKKKIKPKTKKPVIKGDC